MRALLALPFAALAFAPLPVAAQSVSGWYTGIFAGGGEETVRNGGQDFLFGVVGDELFPPVPVDPFDRTPLPADILDALEAITDGDDESGFALFASEESPAGRSVGLIGATIGYGFGNGLRIEGEFAALHIGAAASSFEGGAALLLEEVEGDAQWVGFDADFGLPLGGLGQQTAYFLLANAWYDLDTGTALTPYFGGGIGLAHVSTRATESGFFLGLSSDPEGSEFALAAQLGAGIKLAIDDGISLDLGYRYKAAFVGDRSESISEDDLDFPVESGEGFARYSSFTNGMLGAHTVQAGLTFAF